MQALVALDHSQGTAWRAVEQWFKTAELSAGPVASAPLSKQPHSAGTFPVVLAGPDGVIVNGNVKRLSGGKFAVVEALLEAGPGGLSKDELDTRSGYPKAFTYLKRLLRDQDFAAVLHMPGKSWGRYRIG